MRHEYTFSFDARRAQLGLPTFIRELDPDLTPFQRARAALHVGATPDYLPCRDGEFAEIDGYLEDAIDEGNGLCLCA